jgi:hypothetical protein
MGSLEARTAEVGHQGRSYFAALGPVSNRTLETTRRRSEEARAHWSAIAAMDFLTVEAVWSCPDLADRFDCLIQRDALVSNSMGET